ncbi:tRNA (guanosine(37)-N1)-methyltransferase TrmD [Chloroflexota bacterium]
MRIDVLTLFPEFFELPFGTGIFRRAADSGLIDIRLYNIRDYAHDKHRIVDDSPYGGGPGMVLKPEPIYEALETIKAETAANTPAEDTPIILLTPQGQPLTQEIARELSGYRRLILVCGHYEGVDERVREHMVTRELSIGDYVLTGGELPAMVVMDATFRLIPGVLGSEESIDEESFSHGLLEYAQYTRPADFRGWPVPEILLSGNHAEITAWRSSQSKLRTASRRPDLVPPTNTDSTGERPLKKQFS